MTGVKQGLWVRTQIFFLGGPVPRALMRGGADVHRVDGVCYASFHVQLRVVTRAWIVAFGGPLTMRGSSVAQHRIPPVYACYCLRSLSKANHTYVGSTPDPIRRFRQHNGDVKQGAFYTRFARPWVMDMLVYGFPSKIAALQFEWSWQMPHVSRHLRATTTMASRAIGTYTGRSMQPLFPATRKQTSTSRRGRKKVRWRSSVVPEHKIAVVRALLASEPFCFWGLKVVLLTEYAYGVWHYMASQAQASTQTLRPSSRITQRVLPPGYPTYTCDFHGVLGTATPLSVSSQARYPRLPEAGTCSAWQKKKRAPESLLYAEQSAWAEPIPPARDAETLGLTREVLAQAPSRADGAVPWAEMPWNEAMTAAAAATSSPQPCSLCGDAIEADKPLIYTRCPSMSCDQVYHLTCLARHALSHESPASPRTFCLPVQTDCPSCRQAAVPWPDVVRRVFRRAEAATAAPATPPRTRSRQTRTVREERP